MNSIFVRMKNILKYTGLMCFLIFMACDNEEKAPEKASERVEQKEATNSATTDQSIRTDKTKTILFYGNSLSAGLGVSSEECFAGLIEKRIDSLGLPYKIINAGESGRTTAGGASRVNWILRQPIDIFILELGGNDGLRGIKPADSYKNLQSIIDETKGKYPDVKIIIAGMMAPPNMGASFTSEFRAMFPKLAKENEAMLIPFLLEGVGGIPTLNLPDGIHPNPKGHKIVAENIWSVLEKTL